MTTGVYAIVNEELGQISYIGSSITIERRWRRQICKLRKGTYKGKLQDSFNRLGIKTVSMEVLEETSPEDRWEREQYWLNLYGPEAGRVNPDRQAIAAAKYNSGRKLSEQHKENIRKANIEHLQSEEMRSYLSEIGKGRKFTGEQRQRMSEARKGKSRGPQSAEHIKRKSEAMKLKWQDPQYRENVLSNKKPTVFSEEVKQKMSETRKGRKPSEEARRKMSEAQMGRKHSEETKQKIRDSGLRRWHRDI